MSEEEKEVCECCNYPAELESYSWPYDRLKEPQEPCRLCELCATTFVGNLHQYPSLYATEYRYLGGAICYIGNMLRDEIKKLGGLA